MKKLLYILVFLCVAQTFAQRSRPQLRMRPIEPINPVTTTYYRDADGDSYGNPNQSTQLSSPQAGWVLNNLDCNDGNAAVKNKRYWYPDVDDDGFGYNKNPILACSAPASYVANNLDTCPTIYGSNKGCPDSILETHDFGNKNYIYQEVLKVPSTESSYHNVSDTDKLRSISYFDGLGRKTQSRAIGASPTGKDIVTHAAYDALGRQAREYLPYASSQSNGLYETDAAAKTLAHYNTTQYQNTTNPYSEKIFDGSPLNRVLETGTPGNDWKANPTSDYDHTVKMGYAVNTSTDANHRVRVYKVTLNSSYIPSLSNPSPTYYPLRSLYKTVVKSENWNPSKGKLETTETFTNKFGQTLLKRTFAKVGSSVTPHDTYYVYDVYNNLSYIIPPKVTTQDGVSSTELSELCTQYRYDKYNRLVEKKLPGKGWERIVYDKLNRPILTQSANQGSTGEWIFTKYDAFGRVAYTGIYKKYTSRVALQNEANVASSQYVSKRTSPITIASTNMYYNNGAFPSSYIHKILTINYYDDYTFDKAGLSIPSSVYGIATTSNVKSLPTGSKERVLGTDDWITTITGYDNKARAIYTASKNSYLNTTDITETKLDFIGKALENTTRHTSDATVKIVDKFTYDHADRLLTQKQRINTQAEELITKNSYDALGALKNKKVGNTETKPLQTVDYKYHVRGWLQQINDVDNLGSDLFSLKLNYNTKDFAATTGYEKLYNGNIAETIWKTKTDGKKRGYQYKYDGLSRLTDAFYRENENLTGGGHNYRTEYKYDKNGNITHLRRNAQHNYYPIDVLDYTYNEGNKLTKVKDNGYPWIKHEGFSDGIDVDVEYNYDGNGNLTKDRNKGIGLISYNFLDLPTQVYFSGGKQIDYVYTATGVKLEKRVGNYGSITTTHYAGAFIYENDVLQHFGQPEGYVEKNGSSFTYIYQHTDHLGNVRVNYTNVGSSSSPNLQIREENSYYPFGLKIKGFNNVVVGTQNNYKYNGKELQTEALGGVPLQWYDYGARNYDASLGRFFNVDPLADAPMQVDKSPYAYTWNNPINLTDPDGMHPDWNDNGYINCATGDCSFGFDAMGNFTGSGRTGTNGKSNNPKDGTTDNGNGTATTTNGQLSYTMNTGVGSLSNSTSSSNLKNYTSGISSGFSSFYGNLHNRITSAINSPLETLKNNLVNGIGPVMVYDIMKSKYEGVKNSVTITNHFIEGNYYEAGFMYGSILGQQSLDIGLMAASYGTIKAGNLGIPVYRVYGGSSLRNGAFYSFINPKYVPFYDKFAGLPPGNTRAFMLKGSIPLSNILKNGRIRPAARIGNNFGGFPELKINSKYVNQLGVSGRFDYLFKK